MMIGRVKRMRGPALAMVLAAISVPALADVKAGVDAWSRGDYAAAVREWAQPAAAGDPDAQFNLAQAYRLGRGVDPDNAQAEALYARAAAQGHVKAADNYGLLLFQDGRREEALPYIQAAAGRGDPRAQYLLGIAHFNGDLVAKDWPRAYALLTLANSAGLPQARGALTQMDEYIPLDERQEAQTLAVQLKTQAEANRARDLAAVDLATVDAGPSATVVAAPPQPPVATRPASVATTVATPAPAPARAPAQASGSVATAGADYTLPANTASAPPPPAAPARPVVVASSGASVPAAPKPSSAPVAAPVSAPVAATRVAAASGPWKVQLGAFGVPGNADRLWTKLAGRRELSGRAKVTEPAGRLTKLLAGGYATRADAQAACSSLKASGQDCLVTQ